MKLLHSGIWVLGFVIGCSTEESTPQPGVVAGPGEFGSECKKSEDCASTVCVDLGQSKGICSSACDKASDCPAIDNWDCVVSSTTNLQVCACRKLSQNEICGDGLDNDCDGIADNCRICNGIEVPNDDPANCGACGEVCRSDQSCNNGKCSCPSGTPNDCGVCTNTSKDDENCGACGNACGTGRSCVKGGCECPAGAASTYCPSVGCIDLKTDVSNCGVCGKACTLGRNCTDGSCTCTTATQTFCDGVGCVDFKTDPVNCGGCGITCASDKTCVEGKCSCTESTTLCGDSCVDTKTDAAHCGKCETACPKGQACVNGTCGCTDLGLHVCGDVCANFQTSSLHCGACDHECGPGERCSEGRCVCDSLLNCGGVCLPASDAENCGTCGNQCGSTQICNGNACICKGSNLSVCNKSCVNLANDVTHCGNCETACPTGQSCISGKCGCAYTGQVYCADQLTCVTVSSDSKNCGSCGNVCKGDQYCSSGTCRCSSSGLTYCEQAQACTNLKTDASHCGTCGNTCRNGESCTNGTCNCPSGTSFCEAEGKCVSTNTDANNCGYCGNACRPTESCQSGTCRCSSSGSKFCASANACIDTLYDSNNCSACDKVCPTDSSCSLGACTCKVTGNTLCTDACYDLKTSKDHCGTCANACTGNQVCSASTCTCPTPTVGTPVRLTNNSIDDFHPAIAWDGTHVGVAYVQSLPGRRSDLELRFALLNPDGTTVSNVALTTYVTESSGGLFGRPSLVWNGSEYAVLWIEALSTTKLQFLRLDANGTPKSTPINVREDGSTTSSSSLYSHSLAWSDTNKEYAIAFGGSYSFSFRRLGLDGSTLEAVNSYTDTYYNLSLNEYRQPRIGSAPDGTWMVAIPGSSQVALFQFNADGSRTLVPQKMSVSTDSNYGVWPALLYDGQTWVTAWLGSPSNTIGLNRGTAKNSPAVLTVGDTNRIFGDLRMTQVGADLGLAWTEQIDSSSSLYRFRVQRYSIPATISSGVTALHPPVDILSTYNIAEKDETAIVATGADSMLAVWSDNRWGTADEILAAPVVWEACK